MGSERIETHNESSKIAQEKFHEIYERLTIQIYSLVNKVNSELEEKFTAENNCLQENLSGLRSDEDERISKKVQKANAELLIDQFYGFIKLITDETENEHKFSILSLCELKTDKKAVLLEFIAFEEKRLTNLVLPFTEKAELSLLFPSFS